jgi:hypothetical protein
MLLADLAALAGARGLLVLSAAGRERESELVFAGLRHLLRPLLAELLALPGPLAGPVRTALGLDPPLAGCDAFRIGAALLEVLAGYARHDHGLLMLVDDAHWLDAASLDVLAFAARQLDRYQAAILIAARGAVSPPGLGSGIPQLRLGPLALTELTRAVAASPASARHYAALPLPPTDRLTAVFAAGLGALPSATREALLLVAAAEGTDREAITRALSSLDPAALTPAEEQGLLTVTAQAVTFSHPVIASAVYHSVPFASRSAAHRELAEVLSGQPDRRAWHLGAATLQPDEGVALLLTQTAPQARQRQGAAAMAAARQRAADLSPEPASQAMRLVLAAEAAISAGHPGWAADLAGRALELPAGRSLHTRAQHVAGQALTWSGRYTSALEILLPLARETDPGAAGHALGLAASAS